MLKHHSLSQYFDKIFLLYIALLPSLLIYTTMSEKTIQNIVIVSLFVFFMWNRRIAWTRQIAAIWLLWVLYASWTCFAGWLVSGEVHGISFVKAALMLTFPVFIAWAQSVDFGLWLSRGFKFALLIGLFVSVYQVFVVHIHRANGDENALIFAACISVFGLFVLHQSLLKGGFSGHWFVVTAIIIVLSGSQGVLVSFVLSVLVLAFFVPRKSAFFSIVIPAFILIVIAVSVAGLLHKNIYIFEKNIKSFDVYQSYLDDFLNNDFTIRDVTSLASDNNSEAQYHLKDKYKNSLGYRIVFLRGGWEVFKQHPFIGVGMKYDTLRVGQALGVGSDLAVYSHVHNAFLQDMVTGGFVKLLLLLLILVVPVVFISIECSKDLFSLALVMTINFMMFGLTNVLFKEVKIAILYALVLVSLYSVCRKRL